MTNNKFINNFNIIFNKIPHIYSEIFIKIFTNNYNYFLDYNKHNNINLFINILNSTFNNINNLNNKDFYYNNIIKYLDNTKEQELINNISNKLSKNIENNYLLDIIDNNPRIIIYNNLSTQLSKIYIYFLISKTLVKIVNLLTFYKSIENIEFNNYIHITVEKYRTIELNMDYVIDYYKDEFKNIISKTDYKILIYLLSLSINGKEIEKNYYQELSKLLDSIGYSTNLHRIINYKRISYPIKPYIYKNISILINILFKKYHDNYYFITNKEKLLKTCFYLYIKKINLPDKIIISITYPLLSYEWDSIKDFYENYFNKNL